MRISRVERRTSHRQHLLRGIALTCSLLFVPLAALSQLRPLVPDMLANLSAINRIGAGAAIEDYEQVEAAARELKARANQMRELDLASFEFDPGRDPE